MALVLYFSFLVLPTFLVLAYDFNPFDRVPKVYGNSGNSKDFSLCTIIEEALLTGQLLAKYQFDYNAWLPTQGVYMTRNSSGFFRFNSGPLPPEISNKNRASMIILKGLEVFLDSGGNLEELYKKNLRVDGICEDITKKIFCFSSKDSKGRIFRSFDGTCNNLRYPFWGSAQSAFTRLLQANYEDNIHQPRLSVAGKLLPSPRKISVKIFGKKIFPDAKLSLFASEMSQIIAHDTQQALPDNVEGGPILCCTNSGSRLPLSLQHSSCMPIIVPKNDTLSKKYNCRCLNFIRSLTIPRMDCLLGPAEQINMVTSFLDCSFIYGNSKELANTLRSFQSGKLLESSPNKYRMLPLTDFKMCDFRSKLDSCYLAGDSRVNQNPYLVAMHVVFLREHNRIAEELKKLNPFWKDEKLFQETRRIVIAIYQHIVYKEYLPLFIGRKFIENLFTLKGGEDPNGFTDNYDENVNPGSINSMNIIFRCFHTTLPDKIQLYNSSGHIKSECRFSEYMARPVICCQNHDQILNSLCLSPMMKIGVGATKEVTQNLFKSTAKYGLDLISMDIQRERDHGIPGYNNFREFCGLGRVSSFEELLPIIGVKNVKKLQSLYKHVDDIDLLVGGLLEYHVKGTEFGPVFLHILRKQFSRYMIGDRFFYTNKNQDYPFTKEQLNEIKKVTAAHLICDNSNNIQNLQRKAFEIVTDSNPKIKCDHIPRINLRPWQEN